VFVSVRDDTLFVSVRDDTLLFIKETGLDGLSFPCLVSRLPIHIDRYQQGFIRMKNLIN
jgi:hypothetical protein